MTFAHRDRSNSTPVGSLSPAREIDGVDGLDSIVTEEEFKDSELIQPDEVSVSDAITVEAVQVREPIQSRTPLGEYKQFTPSASIHQIDISRVGFFFSF